MFDKLSELMEGFVSAVIDFMRDVMEMFLAIMIIVILVILALLCLAFAFGIVLGWTVHWWVSPLSVICLSVCVTLFCRILDAEISI